MHESPVKLNTPQSAPLWSVESARAAPDFSAQFVTKTLPMPRATGICAPATCSCCRPAYHCCPAAAAAATAAARLAQRSVLAVASRPERWCQPRRAAPQKRVSFTLLFLRKSVVLTSTMSSKHSYARSGERGEKREDGQQGEREKGRADRGEEGHGERRASTQLDRTRGIDEGTPTGHEEREKRGEERGEQERTEQNREETGERREERG